MLPYLSENAVKKAVKIIGGVTKASNLLGVSNGAVHSWVKRRRVTNIDYARKLAELSGVGVERIRPC
jgi:DNA-binding transcriptional regulator YdaS (Cro superfamily)